MHPSGKPILTVQYATRGIRKGTTIHFKTSVGTQIRTIAGSSSGALA